MKIDSIRQNYSNRTSFGATVKTNELTTQLTHWTKSSDYKTISGWTFYTDLQKSFADLSQVGGDTVLELSSKKPLKTGTVHNRLIITNPLNGKQVRMPIGIEIDHFSKIIQKAIRENIFS